MHHNHADTDNDAEYETNIYNSVVLAVSVVNPNIYLYIEILWCVKRTLHWIKT
jgi:hypothetical protein